MNTVTTAPRVAIVVRTLNRPYFLARAMRDILAQTYTGWHVVVSNDGGDSAATRDALEPFLDDLAGRITVVDVAAPHGRCAAANQGIRAVEAEFVVLHDDDDSWHPEFLATTVEWLDAHPDDSGVMVPIEILYERERRGEYVVTDREPLWPGMTQITFLDMLQVNRAVPISFLYRRTLHDAVGFYDETLDAVEDWEFYLRVTLDHHIGFVVGRPLAYWALRPSARGHSGNSMFALGDIHERYDTIVRDRALREFTRQYGPGIPLLMAGLMERSLTRQAELMRGGRPLRTFVLRVGRRLFGRR